MIKQTPKNRRREQVRQAQARYKARHARTLELIRVVFNILRRQDRIAGDMETLATALQSLLSVEDIKTVQKALSRQVRKTR